jgi:hypothetical protein
MKFYAEPGLLIRPRKNGVMKRFKPFRFDTNGEYETENPILIKALKRKFKTDSPSDDAIESTEEIIEDVMDDEAIRAMAKDNGIKSWHTKSIKRLKEELGL